jgi:hypothetical protein
MEPSDVRMNSPATDPSQPYRGLIGIYTDAIRASDFKANIALLFVEFMMGPILWNYTKLPSWLPIEIVLQPFLIAYLCLILVLRPRYPKAGAKNFRVARNLGPDDFDNIAETENAIEQLQLRCAVLSHILWWKTLYIRISFSLAIVCTLLTLVILIFYLWRGG